MVKGTTRQVVVVKSADPKLFDQAIFLVRDDVLMKGGITEEALLAEARHACGKTNVLPLRLKLLWALGGAGTMGLLWLLLTLL